MDPFSPTRHARNLDFTKGFQWLHAGFCLRSRGTLIRILCPLTRKACFPNGFWPVPRIHHGFQGGFFSAKPDLLVFPLFLHESWGWFFLTSTCTYVHSPQQNACYMHIMGDLRGIHLPPRSAEYQKIRRMDGSRGKNPRIMYRCRVTLLCDRSCSRVAGRVAVWMAV